MATELEKNGILEITGIAADWDYKASKPASWPANPRLTSIKFNPGAASDALLVNQKEAGGPEAFYARCADINDQRIEYYHGGRCIPYIDFSGCTLSANHKVVIKLWRES